MNLKTVAPNFIKNIVMEEPQTCWAACIDMVVKENNIQKKVVEKLMELEHPKCTSTTMPPNKDYYSKLFKNNLFSYKGCTQYQSSNFPKKDFIIDCINKDRPIIFSGIFYPLLYDNKSHAFVVEGYKQDGDIFWILAIDPIRQSRTCKIAWVYNELIKLDTQKRIRTDEKIDFITEFEELTSAIYQLKDFISDTLPGNHEYANPNSLKKTIDLVNLVKDNKKELLESYFGISTNAALDANHPLIPWIPKYEINCFLDMQTSKQLFYYPVWDRNKEVVLEFIFYEEEENKLTLIGIKEPETFYKLLEAKIYRNGQLISLNLNHENRNYEVFIDTNDNVYLKIDTSELGNQTFYIPANDYKNPTGEILLKGQGYSEIELNKFNIEQSKYAPLSSHSVLNDLLLKEDYLKNLDETKQKIDSSINQKPN